MAVEVRTPEDYMGDVIGDLNSRRGQIQAMEDVSGAKVVRALVPLSEMFGYVGDLRSKTQGRAELLACSSTPTPRFRATSPRRSSRRPAASRPAQLGQPAQPHNRPQTDRSEQRTVRPDRTAYHTKS